MCQFKQLPWWIPEPRIFKTKDKEFNERVSYFPVRYCNTCNKVWEVPLLYTKEKELVYHFDFPTYGLKREKCYACKKNRKKRIYESRRKSSR